jgi:hypothetical protein
VIKTERILIRIQSGDYYLPTGAVMDIEGEIKGKKSGKWRKVVFVIEAVEYKEWIDLHDLLHLSK